MRPFRLSSWPVRFRYAGAACSALLASAAAHPLGAQASAPPAATPAATGSGGATRFPTRDDVVAQTARETQVRAARATGAAVDAPARAAAAAGALALNATTPPINRGLPPGSPLPIDRPPSLLDGIALDAARQAVLRTAWQAEYPQWRAVMARAHAAGGMTDDDRRALDAMSARQMARVAAVLTADERGRYAQNMEARRVWGMAQRGNARRAVTAGAAPASGGRP